MTREEAIEVARGVAQDENWPWVEPVEAVKQREFPWLGWKTWRVETNCQTKTRSVIVYIDDATKQVTSRCYMPY